MESVDNVAHPPRNSTDGSHDQGESDGGLLVQRTICGRPVHLSFIRSYKVPTDVDWSARTFGLSWLCVYSDPVCRGQFNAFFARTMSSVCLGPGYSGFLLVAWAPLLAPRVQWFFTAVGIAVPLLSLVDVSLHVFFPITPRVASARMVLSFLMTLIVTIGSSWVLMYLAAHCHEALAIGEVHGRVSMTDAERDQRCIDMVEPYPLANSMLASIGATMLPLPNLAQAVINMLLTFVLGRWYAAQKGVAAEPAAELTSKVIITGIACGTSVAISFFRFFSAKTAFEVTVNIERQRSETAARAAELEQLLKTIVPAAVLPRLIEGGEGQFTIDRVPSASMLFADMKGFTAWSSHRAAIQVTSMLNTVVAALDHLAWNAPGVEKIKTIGDAYWAVAGIPVPAEDHADQLVLFGWQMNAIVAELNKSHAEWGGVAWRVGVHSGPMTGALFGQRQVSYEVFGETSRVCQIVEANGVPGEVCVTHSVTQALLLPPEADRLKLVASVAVRPATTKAMTEATTEVTTSSSLPKESSADVVPRIEKAAEHLPLLEVLQFAPPPDLVVHVSQWLNSAGAMLLSRNDHSDGTGNGGSVHDGSWHSRRQSLSHVSSPPSFVPGMFNQNHSMSSVRSEPSAGVSAGQTLSSTNGVRYHHSPPLPHLPPWSPGDVPHLPNTCDDGRDSRSHGDLPLPLGPSPRRDLGEVPSGTAVASGDAPGPDRLVGAHSPVAPGLRIDSSALVQRLTPDLNAGPSDDCSSDSSGSDDSVNDDVEAGDDDAQRYDYARRGRRRSQTAADNQPQVVDESVFEVMGAPRWRGLPWFGDAEREADFKAHAEVATRGINRVTIGACVVFHIAVMVSGFVQEERCFHAAGFALQVVALVLYCIAFTIAVMQRLPLALATVTLSAAVVIGLTGTNLTGFADCHAGYDTSYYSGFACEVMMLCVGAVSWPLLFVATYLCGILPTLVIGVFVSPLPWNCIIMPHFAFFFGAITAFTEERYLRRKFLEGELAVEGERRIAALGAERVVVLEQLVPRHVVHDLITWFGTGMDPTRSIARQYPRAVVAFVQLRPSAIEALPRLHADIDRDLASSVRHALGHLFAEQRGDSPRSPMSSALMNSALDCSETDAVNGCGKGVASSPSQGALEASHSYVGSAHLPATSMLGSEAAGSGQDSALLQHQSSSCKRSTRDAKRRHRRQQRPSMFGDVTQEERDGCFHGSLLDKIKTVGDLVMVAGPFPDLVQDATGTIDDPGELGVVASVNKKSLDASPTTKKGKYGVTESDVEVDDQSLHATCRALLRLVRLVRGRCGVRVGAHIGPVVGTVQGRLQLSFDTFGDVVNVASRVMSNAQDGTTLQVTRELRDVMVQGQCGVEFAAPHSVEAKGKGALEVFVVREQSL